MKIHTENGLNVRFMHVGSIVTSNRDVFLVHFPSYVRVSFSVLPATVLSGDWKAWKRAIQGYSK